MSDWARCPDAGLVKLGAARLERLERERVAALTQERGWDVPPDSETLGMVSALRTLAERLDR